MTSTSGSFQASTWFQVWSIAADVCVPRLDLGHGEGALNLSSLGCELDLVPSVRGIKNTNFRGRVNAAAEIELHNGQLWTTMITDRRPTGTPFTRCQACTAATTVTPGTPLPRIATNFG